MNSSQKVDTKCIGNIGHANNPSVFAPLTRLVSQSLLSLPHSVPFRCSLLRLYFLKFAFHLLELFQLSCSSYLNPSSSKFGVKRHVPNGAGKPAVVGSSLKGDVFNCQSHLTFRLHGWMLDLQVKHIYWTNGLKGQFVVFPSFLLEKIRYSGVNRKHDLIIHLKQRYF